MVLSIAKTRARTFPTPEEIPRVAEDLGLELLAKIREADRIRVRVVAEPIFTGRRRESRRYNAVPATRECAAEVAALLR
jgi:hypothetical protein